MFNFPNPPLNRDEARKKAEAAGAVFNLITDMLLSDPSCPEARKIEIQILSETKKLKTKFEDAFLAFAEPVQDMETCEAMLPVRREVLEYIQLMGVGLDSFLAAHPVPAKSGN